ncbi:class I ribonucleotide reductase maintenance protein YfaE [Vibrio penaeicida]|uniref:class I ribonucleotide reductase maintenance protein YfaE n=1 Tax=Vibrio penaeicida TaxID=104609 RepID=UPI00273755EB|nr:class I ribonucleotide reductase maintenance protein YfaE [Vibrio penaeicida]MDP2570619.1 class I ribonucleotide reductase maintenance protein YfaE [Vibrio penaeicida]
MQKIKINELSPIVASSEKTLLEEMESAGFEPEYNCRDGHCGACRCELKSGEVEYVGFAMAFTQSKEILPCICRAKTDVELEKVNYQLKVKSA